MHLVERSSGWNTLHVVAAWQLAQSDQCPLSIGVGSLPGSGWIQRQQSEEKVGYLGSTLMSHRRLTLHPALFDNFSSLHPLFLNRSVNIVVSISISSLPPQYYFTSLLDDMSARLDKQTLVDEASVNQDRNENPSTPHSDAADSDTEEAPSTSAPAAPSGRSEGKRIQADETKDEAAKLQASLYELQWLCSQESNPPATGSTEGGEDHEVTVADINNFITNAFPSELQGVLKLEHVRQTLAQSTPDFDGVNTASRLLTRLYDKETLRQYLWESLKHAAELQDQFDGAIVNAVKPVKDSLESAGLENEHEVQTIVSNGYSDLLSAPELSKVVVERAEAVTMAKLYADSVPAVLAGYRIDARFARDLLAAMPEGPSKLSTRELFDWQNLDRKVQLIESFDRSGTGRPQGFDLNDDERMRCAMLSLRGRFSGELVDEP